MAFWFQSLPYSTTTPASTISHSGLDLLEYRVTLGGRFLHSQANWKLVAGDYVASSIQAAQQHTMH
jgi:hypothetical protein